jgi:hypothetical protein
VPQGQGLGCAQRGPTTDRRIARSLALFVCTVGLVGCAAAPRPLRYVAVETPTSIPPPLERGGRKIEVAHTRFLPNIRLPVDVAKFVRELEGKSGAPVLRNADVNLTTSFCLLVCVNTDRATAEVPP